MWTFKSSTNEGKDQRFTKERQTWLKNVKDRFKLNGTAQEFKNFLSLVTKTGNKEDIIKVIRVF